MIIQTMLFQLSFNANRKPLRSVRVLMWQPFHRPDLDIYYLFYLRGGPPPLHSRRRLRSGGTTFELSSIKFKLQSPRQTEI